jgi:tetratricopeptide (TPR) repeat protein
VAEQKNAFEPLSPAPLVPVSREDFARRKRKIVWICIAAATLVVLLVAWIYKRSMDPVQAREAYDAGERLLRDLRYTQAILSFDRAISLKPDLVDAYLLRARAHVLLSDPEPAVADFTQVIRLRPADAQAYLERASVYLSLQNYQAAMADCSDAISRNPRLAPAYNLRGTALRAIGESRRALTEFNRAVELSPDAENYYQRAATYQLMDQHQEALADLDQVITFRPESSEAYFARARSKRALGDKTGAATDYAQGRFLDNH